MSSSTLGMIFAGQGAQHPGMGAALYDQSAAARKYFDAADKILGWELSRLCFQGPQEELTACAHCQPAIYLVSMAAFAAWQEEHPGEAPAVVGGLSLGELAAFTAAGAFAFEDGLKLVAKRGQLMDECCQRYPGVMTAVIGAEADKVAEICDKHQVDVANYNCPGQLIISGEAAKVAAAAEELTPLAMKVVQLEVAGAYHSRLMREAGEAFAEYLQGVALQVPGVPVVHNVTGDFADAAVESIKERLAQQVYSPVRWENCARTMTTRCQSMLELGPGRVLAGLMKRIERRFPVESTDL